MLRHWQELIILILSLICSGLLASFVLNTVLESAYFGGEDGEICFYLASAVVTQLVMFLGAAFLYFKITKISVADYVKLGWPVKKDWFLLILFFAIAVCLTFLISPLAGLIESSYGTHPWVQHQKAITESQNYIIGNLRGPKIWIALVVFAMLPAFAEEIVFRGIMLRIFKDLTNKRALAIFLSGFVFSVFHFQILSFITILVIGCLLAILYEKTKNLATSILLHFAFNAVQIIFWQA